MERFPRSSAGANGSQVFVARQGVFDQTRRIVGYELLTSAPKGESPQAADRSAARIISDAVVAVGLDELSGSRRAFVPVSRRLLLEGLPAVLPPSRMVLQLAAGIEADRDVLAACDTLRDAGFTIAIDDFVLTPWTAPLVPYASFVKMNVADIDGEVRTRLLTDQAAGGPALIVKDTDSTAVFEAMVAVGCRYFQGDFLGKPVVTSGRTVHAHQLTYLRLLQALNNPNRSLDDLEDLVKHDAALCFRILRTVNSAGFGLRGTVTSIREALLMLGRDTVRRWASLWGLAGLNERAHTELVLIATVRARFCEVIAETMQNDEIGPQAFLAGLCSLLDAILERPMADVLAGLPVSSELKGALLGTDADGPLRKLLECAAAYERGHWQRAIDAAAPLGIDHARLPRAYEDALRWSRELDRQRAVAA
jgi:EAL and modified HD-GYP domain-containing signal transduction protein